MSYIVRYWNSVRAIRDGGRIIGGFQSTLEAAAWIKKNHPVLFLVEEERQSGVQEAGQEIDIDLEEDGVL